MLNPFDEEHTSRISDQFKLYRSLYANIILSYSIDLLSEKLHFRSFHIARRNNLFKNTSNILGSLFAIQFTRKSSQLVTLQSFHNQLDIRQDTIDLSS